MTFKHKKKLKDTVEYIFSSLEYNPLSYSDLTYLLYLIDWKYALETRGKTLSKVCWYSKDSHPYTVEIDRWLERTSRFSLEKPTNDPSKWFVKLCETSTKKEPHLNEKGKRIIDFVTEAANQKGVEELVRFTYPLLQNIKQGDAQYPLNFHFLANEYLNQVRPTLNA